jgi:hypothetical protein
MTLSRICYTVPCTVHVQSTWGEERSAMGGGEKGACSEEARSAAKTSDKNSTKRCCCITAKI